MPSVDMMSWLLSVTGITDVISHTQDVWRTAPHHIMIEVLLVLLVLYLLLAQSYRAEDVLPLSSKEIDQLVDEWEPAPLHPTVTELQRKDIDEWLPVIDGPAGQYVTVNGKKLMNLATFNFLGYVENKQVIDEAQRGLRIYGVGSCGPRGFYGTIDVHLELEEKLTKFMRTEATIVYASQFATIASVIPAFAKRPDTLLVDEACSFATKTGVLMSRSKVKYFRHNDMAHLHELMMDVARSEQRNGTKPGATRRFVVVEGLYQSTGDVCPLPKVVEYAKALKWRIILEESYSIGVLGEHGRGLTEYLDVPVKDVDIITGSLGHSFGGIGGFCTGSSMMVDHQRLSGSGYCFSASLPPMVAMASTKALEMMIANPSVLAKLANNSAVLRRELAGLPMAVATCDDSPLLHLRLKQEHCTGDQDADEEILQRIVMEAMDNGVLLTRAKYTVHEVPRPQPSIRLAVSAAHSEQEMKKAAQTITQCASRVLSSL